MEMEQQKKDLISLLKAHDWQKADLEDMKIFPRHIFIQ